MSYDSTRDTELHIERVRELLVHGPIRGLQERAMVHDASKLEEPEKSAFDQFTPDLRRLEYGTPEYREALAHMRPALEHHYDANDHHPEHFDDGIYDMDLLQLVELLADWKAAGERHAGGGRGLRHSIEVNAERFGYDTRMANLLIRTAEHLGWI